MKAVVLYSSIILATFAFQESKAQVHVDINIGQPAYVVPAPVEARYYYLPDVEAYYYVPQKVYYYQNRGRWISSRRLPGYRNYNVYNVRHIVVNEPRPYLRHNYYHSRYNNRSEYREYRHKDRGHGRENKGHTHRGRGRH